MSLLQEAVALRESTDQEHQLQSQVPTRQNRHQQPLSHLQSTQLYETERASLMSLLQEAVALRESTDQEHQLQSQVPTRQNRHQQPLSHLQSTQLYES